MKKTIYFIAALATVFLASCSNDELPQTEENLPIRLATTLTQEGTRSFDAINIRNQSTVYVWADMVNLSDGRVTDYFNAWALTADGNGGMAPVGAIKFFPATNALNLYALKGNFSGIALNEYTELPTTGIYHTVATDQRSENAYYNSDLLYAVVKNQEPIAGDVVLPFYHMLSKIQVVLIPGNGGTNNDLLSTDILKEATVTILGVKTRAKLTPSKEKDIAEQTDRAGMITTAPPLGEETENDLYHNILVKTETNNYAEINDQSYGDAIIVPQTVKAGNFIQVDFLDRTVYYRLDSAFQFESGKKYRFRLIIDRIGEEYTITPDFLVAPWGENETVPTDLSDLKEETPRS